MSDHPEPDQELLEELRSLVARVDPVPADVTGFARAALGWRRLDADLAELLVDSALEAESTSLTRSAGATGRWVTFRAAELAVDVEIRVEGEAITLLGQLAPPSAGARVEVQAADGGVAASATADELGRFRLELGGGGRVRLRILRLDPAAVAVETSWLSL